MNINNVKKRTVALTLTFGEDTAEIHVMPDVYTSEFEDMRDELIMAKDAKPSAALVYVIKNLVAKWDLTDNVKDADGNVIVDKNGKPKERPLSPQVDDDIRCVPTVILYAITKGVRELNAPTPTNATTSESSFS